VGIDVIDQAGWFFLHKLVCMRNVTLMLGFICDYDGGNWGSYGWCLVGYYIFRIVSVEIRYEVGPFFFRKWIFYDEDEIFR